MYDHYFGELNSTKPKMLAVVLTTGFLSNPMNARAVEGPAATGCRPASEVVGGCESAMTKRTPVKSPNKILSNPRRAQKAVRGDAFDMN